MKRILFVITVLLIGLASCGGSGGKNSGASSTYGTSQSSQPNNAPIICTKCNGLGVNSFGLQCDACGGTGYFYNPSAPASPASGGYGTDDNRYVKCAACNGTGKCFMCDGTGWFVYDGGYGQSGGVKSCEYCYGNGLCPTCHGTGKVLR